MDGSLRRVAERSWVVPAGMLVWALLVASAPLRDEDPAWFEDDRGDIPMPQERDPSVVWDGIDQTLFGAPQRALYPPRIIRSIVSRDDNPDAGNVNAVDEVPNSTWFTNRIGLFPMTPEEAALGPGTGIPDRSAPWRVVGAKTEGVSPGFQIRDGAGAVWLLKFDPPGFLGTTSAAAVIANKILHAAGYNVPEDGVVDLRRDALVVDEKATIPGDDGEDRPMTEADLDAILEQVPRTSRGTWKTITSKFLSGKPAGAFNWEGNRDDDPNDAMNHEHRRELRALKAIGGWINHFDTKQANTLDMYVEEGGAHFLRHYLIDFASTLGAGASGPAAKFGWEYSFDPPPIFGRLLALGFQETGYRKVERPEGLPEIGFFESKHYDPAEWKPLIPNAAFGHMNDADAYWGAKIVTAFTDDHLAAIVAQGQYEDPQAGATMVRILAERRDKLGRTWFDQVPPLDFFTFADGVLRFRDLGTERGIYPETATAYRFRVGPAEADRDVKGWFPWRDLSRPEADTAGITELEKTSPADAPFLAFELTVRRGDAWSRPVTVFASRASGRIVAVSR